MATFQASVLRIDEVQPHPKADRLDIVRIKGYRSVVKRGAHRTGELVVYIPEQALLPPWLLQEMGFWKTAENTGALAGPRGNRVHPLELRGVFSQGLVLGGVETSEGRLVLGQPFDGDTNITASFAEGEDAAEWLGITKYEVTVPAELAGSAFALELPLSPKFDIDDIKAWPDAIAEGEEVVMTEKLHGTFLCVGRVSEADATAHGRTLAMSKGLADQGMAFIPDEVTPNVYLRAAEALPARVLDALVAHLVRERLAQPGEPVWVMGEAFGPGTLQDLTYGIRDVAFCGFSIAVGYRSGLRHLDFDDMKFAFDTVLCLPTAPLVYRGPFSATALAAATTGRESFSRRQLHIREGVVVVPVKDRRIPDLGRVALKSVSPDYLKRANGTEYR